MEESEPHIMYTWEKDGNVMKYVNGDSGAIIDVYMADNILDLH